MNGYFKKSFHHSIWSKGKTGIRKFDNYAKLDKSLLSCGPLSAEGLGWGLGCLPAWVLVSPLHLGRGAVVLGGRGRLGSFQEWKRLCGGERGRQRAGEEVIQP